MQLKTLDKCSSFSHLDTNSYLFKVKYIKIPKRMIKFDLGDQFATITIDV